LAAAGTAPLADIKGGAQEQKIEGGAQQISIRLAASLGAGVVHLRSPVTRIQQRPDGVVVMTATGRAWTARYAVVALPPFLAHTSIAYDLVPSPWPAGVPRPPEMRDTLRARLGVRMPMGSIIKVLVIYQRPFWRDRGFSGQTMSDVEPLALTYDATPPDSSYGALVGFIAGKHAVELAQQSAEVCCAVLWLARRTARSR